MKNYLRIFSTLCCAKFKRTHFTVMDDANKALNEKYLYKKAVKEAWEWKEEKQCRGHKRDLPSLQIFAMKSFQNIQKQAAFSLVELLMALLVASLLMAALAPVMTKRITENIHVDGNMNPPTANVKKIEIDYNSNSPENNFKCTEIKTDTDGSEYCEGEFTVPNDYNGIMKITVIGAGGGGGTAPTAGYTEYTTVSNTHQFTVPAMVNKAEVTLVSGGAGGGAGGQITKTQTFVTYGNGNITADSNNKVTVESSGKGTWTIPEAVRNRYLLATACGGGGGAGCGPGTWHEVADSYGYGGGSGGYVKDASVTFANANELTYYIGGGGAGAYVERYNGTGNPVISPSYAGGSLGDSSKVPDSGYSVVSTIKGGAGGKGVETKGQEEITGVSSYTLYTTGGDGGSTGAGYGAAAHWGSCYCGNGGGGGGATQLLVGSGIYFNAPGGGGGSGWQRVAQHYTCPPNSVGGGGGGGGSGGGAGGGQNDNAGKGGTGGTNASAYSGGTINTIFGNNYCNGGNGVVYTTGIPSGAGFPGKPGAMRLTYLDYGPGGSGGGGATIIPVRSVNVNPNEALTVAIGAGGKGNTGGRIDEVSKKIILPIDSNEEGHGKESYIARGTNKLLRTNNNVSYAAHCGCSNGKVNIDNCAISGWLLNGILENAQPVSISGFSTGKGKAAGNKSETGNITYAPGTIGGDGGDVSIFNGEIKCVGGKGGTKASPDGKSPVSGYGCGGGGGYSFGKGGDGSGGYARISWNKYWDTATSAYKNANIGAGGGGASGNVLTYTISVISGQKIRVRIGKGGKGATVSNNTLINATKGGDTIFGDSAFGEIKAGGGYGGISPSVNTTTSELINGTGGNISNICHYKSTSLLNKSSCKKGIKGFNAENATGGKGADLPNYGTGGKGGIPGDNSDGTKASDTGYGAGGGGAALRDLGRVDSSTQTNITRNENKGGDGSNGRIIIEWWE